MRASNVAVFITVIACVLVEMNFVTAHFQECFCQLVGQVDDCTCDINTVDHFNNVKLWPFLKPLMERDYFRYFKVNLNRECPFWPDDTRCAFGGCHVESCTEEEVPSGLRTNEQQHNKYSQKANEDSSCEDEDKELGAVDTSISAESKEAFKDWKEHDEALDIFCQIDDDASVDAEYVDLLLNPERFTGYKGASPWRIWKAIYEENCFKPEPGYGNYVTSSTVGDMCLEKRAFFRAVSGLHTSINVHLCADYLFPSLDAEGRWGLNTEEFRRRFDPEFTYGEGPQRLRNLYFVYLLELRALAKAAPYFQQIGFYTGNEEEDAVVQKGVNEVLNNIRSFPNHFNESEMFQGDSKTASKLKEEFRLHFLNISRIMDCVGCDKCRLWGKLQVQGLGTALKILFSTDIDSNINSPSKMKGMLQRTEIVSLWNAFSKLSESVAAVELFRKQKDSGR